LETNSESILLRRLYWTSFGLRLAVGLLALFLTRAYKLPLLQDALFYSEMGASVAKSWLSGQQHPWLAHAIVEGRQAWFMVATLAAIYCLTGGVEVVPLALGCYCLLTSFSPVLAYRAGRQLGVPLRGALTGARLIAYSPAFAFWSGALYKEGLILITLFLVIEHALRLQKSFQPSSVLVLTVCLSALFGLRFYIAAVLCVCILLGLALGRRSSDKAEDAPVIVRQVLVLVMIICVFSLFGLREKVDRILAVGMEDNLRKLFNTRRAEASYSSGFLQNAKVTDVDSAARFLPVGLAYFLTVPLPWQLGSLRQNMTIPDTLFWVLIVYPRVLRGIWRAANANPSGTAFLLFSSVVICCLCALMIGNIGTVYRMRTQVWAIWALFAGWGWKRDQPGEGNPSVNSLHYRPA
jgi:hypothetical protein